ncbi:MAG: acyltransferase, partial [Clostridia bacterium]|nr:acyltransferase [Clostridia bacterium]
TLASNVRILAHDASTAKIWGVRTKVGIVKIGNNVFIGADSIVLCNTRIGDNVIIGVGSVVTKDIPSNSVYAGNPAKYVCSFEEYTKKHQKNQETHPICREHSWKEWQNASPTEWEDMRNKLKDTFGYL